MQLRVLSRSDVARLMPMDEAIEAVAAAFAGLADGSATVPVRTGLGSDAGTALFMPGWMEGSRTLGAKVVSVFPKNAQAGLPAIHAAVLLLDPDTGAPAALLDGTGLTALRTGAASGVATRHLAREDARTLALFGAGAQAPAQIDAVLAVREVREVRVVSRTGSSARRLAEALQGTRPDVRFRAVADAAEAVRDADVVVTATDSETPVFPGGAVAPGTHVNGIGSYTTAMREVDGELLARAGIFVDARDAALEEAGDLVQALEEGRIDGAESWTELGEVVLGRHPGRRSADEVTFFKSVGSAAQDLEVAARILARAREEEAGTVVEL